MASLNPNNVSSYQSGLVTMNKFNTSYLNESKYSQYNDVSSERINYTFKVIMVGDVGIGKTSVIKRYIKGYFEESYKCTLNAEFEVKKINLDAMTAVDLTIWDTSGSEKYRSLTRNYFRDAQGILLMYDISSRDTFLSLSKWIKDIKDNVDIQKCVIYLVGNKNDKERKTNIEEGEAASKEIGSNYYEVSAKEGINIELLFDKLTRDMIKKVKEGGFQIEPKKNLNLSKANKSGIKMSEQSLNMFKSDVGKLNTAKKNQRDVSCC